MDGRAEMVEQLRRQAGNCESLGSSLSARLLRAAAADTAAGGPVAGVLAPYEGSPPRAAVPLRLMAAVHRIVLERRAPGLALHYPSVGGTSESDGAAEAFLATVEEHAEELRAAVARPCQTNEIGRCAALLVGFLAVARETGLPLRLLEVGASAGLNLRWDHYRYEQGDVGWAWGPEGSPVLIDGRWRTPPPPDPPTVEVVERRGCDPAPVDATTADGRTALTASVWPDQTGRFEHLRGAFAVAAEVPVLLDATPVEAWLPNRLAEPAEGTATVVFQSVVDQYLSDQARVAQHEALGDAGAQAVTDAPLAWLRLEPVRGTRDYGIDLRTWPDGEDRQIGISGAHGAGVTTCP